MITSLLLLATLFLIQARMPLAFLATWAHCWLIMMMLYTDTASAIYFTYICTHAYTHTYYEIYIYIYTHKCMTNSLMDFPDCCFIGKEPPSSQGLLSPSPSCLLARQVTSGISHWTPSVQWHYIGRGAEQSCWSSGQNIECAAFADLGNKRVTSDSSADLLLNYKEDPLYRAWYLNRENPILHPFKLNIPAQVPSSAVCFPR